MKKSIAIILAFIMVSAVFGGCASTATIEPAQETAQAQTAAIEPTEELSKETGTPDVPGIPPSDLLNEDYNPFFSVEFPESYTVYMAEYEDIHEYALYYLHLTTTDSAQDVVTYMSNLLGDSAAESIAQNLSALEDEGMVNIHGTEVDAGLNADCSIEPSQQDGDYEYVEGYVISMVMRIDAEDMESYGELLLSNANLDALAEVSNYINVADYDMAGIKVNLYQGRTEVHIGCYLENVEQVWNDMAAAMPDNYSEEYSAFSFENGEFSTDIREDLNGGFIHIFQGLARVDVALKDYAASETEFTLGSLGFLDFREAEANVCYKDDDQKTGVFIYKDEWGEPEFEDQRETVSFNTTINNCGVAVKFYPNEDRYAVHLEVEGVAYEYEYYDGESRYLNENGQDDLDAVKEAAEIVFSKPDTDSVLQDAWVTFEQYVENTFGMNAAELYALSYE